ncbi:alkaline phosphatase D [Pseudoxanthomonas japonensis]|uniref:alkaline phosphatase D family protein n=1 Tax=Pseudoxanthomonas japonensis TaxID=69284 RepID=UPI0028677276|nr:alkaline phosphatase D family protein [Pseudoxanthomonas japonensis]MDR7069411.1 alkaline phosphatase D [Pseudoxanthomonas japonensis]
MNASDSSALRASRRTFLKLTLAAASLPFASRWFPAQATPTVSRTAFPQSLASGDPRPDRVLLWTRVPAAVGDVAVRLQVADDAAFSQLRIERELTAQAAHDHCLRVRVAGLLPGRRYHYRFLRREGDGWVSSPVGMTRTAPAADAPTPALRFAFMSCQDYGGRWYNSLVPLLQEDLDFILHLGDFIYESIGDSSFQRADGGRGITFDDVPGALRVGAGDQAYLAASSLDNYRQLHREYRTDPVLQALLERAPLVAIWDDHEFSDDCWQDHATYEDGRRPEGDARRRRHAERAYFEYMPVDIDVGDVDDRGAQRVDEARLYPQGALWRRLDYGRDVRLLLLDYRSQRPDHPIPEDAFPGALAYDEPALRRLAPIIGVDWTALSAALMPYADLGDETWASLRTPLRRALTRGYTDAGVDKREAARRATALSTQPMAIYVLRDVLRRYNDAVPGFMKAEMPPEASDGYLRGLPWLALGKSALFSHLGSRYMVVKDSYDLLLALRQADGALPPALGERQQAWLADQLADNDGRSLFVASSVSMTPMVLDLSDPALDAPPLLRRTFYLNVDQWDGFGVQRDALVAALDRAGGAVVLSGDIHASFATQHSDRTVEFTAPAISSSTLSDIMGDAAKADAATAEAGTRLVAALDVLLGKGDARIRHVQTTRHGVGLIQRDAAGDTAVDFLLLPADLCAAPLYDQAARIAEAGTRVSFTFAPGREGERPLRSAV